MHGEWRKPGNLGLQGTEDGRGDLGPVIGLYTVVAAGVVDCVSIVGNRLACLYTDDVSIGEHNEGDY